MWAAYCYTQHALYDVGGACYGWGTYIRLIDAPIKTNPLCCSSKVNIAAALETVADINVPEILRGHSEGVHVKEIAEKSKTRIDPGKLGAYSRKLRMLS